MEGKRSAPDPGIWRDIHGFEGKYQVSYSGQIRRLYKNAKPKILVPHRKAGAQGRKVSRNRLMIGLVDDNGKKRVKWVHQIVAEHFLWPPRPGEVLYHKNGVVTDNWASNLGYITKDDLGKRTGHISKAQPVVQIDQTGELTRTWRSAREAAKDCFMSYQTIIDRCNGGYKKDGKHHTFKSIFAPDGYAYAWDDDHHIGKVLRIIAKEQEDKPVIVSLEGYDMERGEDLKADRAIWYRV